MKKSSVFAAVLMLVGFAVVVAVLVKSELGSHGDDHDAAVAVVETDAGTAAPVKEPPPAAVAKARKIMRREAGDGPVAATGAAPAKAPLLSDGDDMAAEAAVIDQVMKRYHGSLDQDDKYDLLDEMVGFSNPKLVELVAMFMNDPDPEIKVEALSLLADFEDPVILPAVEKALDDEHEEVRLAAVESLADLQAPDADALLVVGVNDTHEDVREASFDIIEDRGPAAQEAALRAAVLSPHADARERVLSIAYDTPSHRVMDVLIEGLKSENKDYREDVTDAIEFFVDEEFGDYNAAKRWWDKNRDNYGEELFEK